MINCHAVKKINHYILPLVILIFLSGCADKFIEPYGAVSADIVQFDSLNGRVTIPENAPSISQGYKPKPKAVSAEDQDYIDQQNYHEGIDIIDKVGTPVIAPAAGTVIDSFFEPFYGNRVILSHGMNADGVYIRSKFFHLQKRLVQVGDKVRRGQQIGNLGRTGLLSGGFPHLHFELRTALTPEQNRTDSIYPHQYWLAGAGNITCFDIRKTYPDMPIRITYPVPCLGVPWEVER